ncbi:MAG: ATP-binding protein [Chloroflexota bacterium]|nr:ATP-binding protein [Chloroflexota bacterium]
MPNISEVLSSLPAAGSVGDGGHVPPDDEPDDFGNGCEQCGGHGWISPNVPVGHADFGTIAPCQCQESRLEDEQRDRLLTYSNLGHLTRFRFENLDPDGLSDSEISKSQFRKAYDVARVYANDPRGWLTFTAPNGAGKTHLAAAIANHCVDSSRIVFFSHAPDLLDHLRSSFGPASETSYSDLFEQVRSTPLLVLDGLGSQSATPWAEEKLRQIINHRFNAELPTIVTTAIPLNALDPYIATRLTTRGLGRVVELGLTQSERLEELGRIPENMLNTMTFERFSTSVSGLNSEQRKSVEAAYHAAQNFAERPDGWLVLTGRRTGVGKTHLAIAVAERQLQAGRQITYYFMSRLIFDLQTLVGTDPARYADLFDRVSNAPFLIIDNLRTSLRFRDTENGRSVPERWLGGTPWAEDQLYHIITHRHSHRLTTIITSPENFSEQPGPFGSLLQDPTISQIIDIDANDYRTQRP